MCAHTLYHKIAIKWRTETHSECVWCVIGRKKNEMGKNQLREFHLYTDTSLILRAFFLFEISSIRKGNKQFINIICSSVSCFFFFNHIAYLRLHCRRDRDSRESTCVKSILYFKNLCWEGKMRWQIKIRFEWYFFFHFEEGKRNILWFSSAFCFLFSLSRSFFPLQVYLLALLGKTLRKWLPKQTISIYLSLHI